MQTRGPILFNRAFLCIKNHQFYLKKVLWLGVQGNAVTFKMLTKWCFVIHWLPTSVLFVIILILYCYFICWFYHGYRVLAMDGLWAINTTNWVQNKYNRKTHKTSPLVTSLEVACALFSHCFVYTSICVRSMTKSANWMQPNFMYDIIHSVVQL